MIISVSIVICSVMYFTMLCYLVMMNEIIMEGISLRCWIYTNVGADK